MSIERETSREASSAWMLIQPAISTAAATTTIAIAAEEAV
jgi:hypothetical protein